MDDCPACGFDGKMAVSLTYQCRRCGSRWLRIPMNPITQEPKVITTEVIMNDPVMSKVQKKRSGPMVSWNRDDVIAWIRMGKNQNAISEEFGISTATIGRIRREMRGL